MNASEAKDKESLFYFGNTKVIRLTNLRPTMPSFYPLPPFLSISAQSDATESHTKRKEVDRRICGHTWESNPGPPVQNAAHSH